MRERYFMALFRSKAPHAHRRQEVVSVTTYTDPISADMIARRLISQAQNQFQCNKRDLIADRMA